ncbi:MAG TPA: hypothetical protein PKD86_10500 [Gemmatales bacterium]|nr:hypothetical protein [Gemmatales bacterium]HMP59774.1 hypothetical protein [Gemmatales bacterium]
MVVADDTLVERVKREAPQAWERYRVWAAQNNVQGSFRNLDRKTYDGGKVFFDRTMSVRANTSAQAGFCIEVFGEQHPNDDARKESVVGMNSKYAFGLRRSDSTQPWVLNHIEFLKEPGARPTGLLYSPASFPSDLHRIPYSIFTQGITFETRFRDPDFHILDASLASSSEEVRLEFATPPKRRPSGSWDSLARGTLVLNPARQWAITSFRLELGMENGRRQSVTGSYEYRDVADGMFLPAQLRFETNSEGKGGLYDIEFELKTGSQPPESDFTLSAFGLPEPFGIEWERPTPWWLYALFSAGVLFIVTVIVSFWKRRLAARSAA